ncbi:AraC family transcriptional regulator, partial [Streptomyces hainanensis]|uniref:AraC family transcriptional regulator n=1 Tax=Streptomyces hainanensis TaxID=402648 RepID=UPI0031332536
MPVLDRLAATIDRHRSGDWCRTAVPRLGLVAVDASLEPTDMRYEPMVCFVADGAKRATAGEREWLTERGEMMLTACDLPIRAEFEKVPYRSAVLLIDGPALADVLLAIDGGPDEEPVPSGPATAPMSPELVDAVTRWVGLLDAPEDIRPLAAGIEGEILYRLLRGPLGPTLRQWSIADSAVSRVRAATHWILAHYTEPLTVAAIAEVAHMSPATLHRHFKAATGMSPLRFQKHLRLQDARRRLLAGDTTAAEVARQVGYVSPTQFNREYRRVYGLP